MFFSYSAVVLAALSLECALAQPAHRHVHKHARNLDEVLNEKRTPTDFNSNIYHNADGTPFSQAQWACFSTGKTDCPQDSSSSGSSPAAPAAAPAASSPAVDAKQLNAVKPSSAPASQPTASSAPSTGGSVSSGSYSGGSGPGVYIANKGSASQTLAFYENDSNGYGQHSNPGKTYTLDAGKSQFVSLPTTWKGHIQRNSVAPNTWAEFQIADDKGVAWGDITLQQGCDGPAVIKSLDDGKSFGFTNDIISNAPAAAVKHKSSGQKALDTTVGGYGGVSDHPNQATIDYLNSGVLPGGQTQVYILGGTGTDCVQSKTQQLAVEFY